MAKLGMHLERETVDPGCGRQVRIHVTPGTVPASSRIGSQPTPHWRVEHLGGYGADVSLNAIAKRANVANATLTVTFPPANNWSWRSIAKRSATLWTLRTSCWTSEIRPMRSRHG